MSINPRATVCPRLRNSARKTRDSMIVVSRMTKYDSDDIEEYMTNSFENAVWDWGYLALILC